MHKNALFLEKKTVTNRRSVGASAPNPRWPPAAGASVPRLSKCYSYHLLQLFSRLRA